MRLFVIAMIGCTSTPAARVPAAPARTPTVASVPTPARTWATFASDICSGIHAPVRIPVLTGVALDPAHTERFDGGVIYPTKNRDDVRSVTQRAADGIVYEQSFETQHSVAELCGVLGLDVDSHDDWPYCARYDGHLRLVISRAEHGNWMWCEWYTPSRF